MFFFFFVRTDSPARPGGKWGKGKGFFLFLIYKNVY